MRGTPVLRTAYNGGMQPLLLFALLAMMQQPDFNASLQKFLQFYRENRAVLAALAGEPVPATDPPKEKRRPEKDGEEDVLTSYLKNLGVR